MKPFKNKIFDNVENMIDHVKQNSQCDCLIIVMFKSRTCPPCIATSRMLRDIDSSGSTNFDTLSNDFCHSILSSKNINLHGVFFLEYDYHYSSGSLPRDKETLDIFTAIDKEKSTIRGFPTFSAFKYINKNIVKITVNQSGFMNQYHMSIYFDGLFKYF